MSFQLNLFNEQQTNALNILTESLSREQLLWVNGYFQGLLSSDGKAIPAEMKPVIQVNKSVKILYGTHTGKSKTIAEKLAGRLSSGGVQVHVIGLDEYKTRQIGQEKNLIFIVSTHGEGEPPIMAEDFHGFITGKRAPKLPELNYSVLALGDKSYKLFCKTGTDIDEALTKLGAKTLIPIAKLDVDFEEEADLWMNQVTEAFAGLEANSVPQVLVNSGLSPIEYSRKKPFQATVIDKVKITGRDSDKEVYHIELSLEGSGISYEPGDSIGILANNPPSLVDSIIGFCKLNEEETVNLKEGSFSIREALSDHMEITVINRDVIQKYQEKVQNEKLQDIINNEENLDNYLYGHDILDLLQEFPSHFSAQELADVLRNFPPRLYSISSSQSAVGDEVHITVATVRYQHKDRKREGACSTYLSDRISVDSTVSVFVEKNPSFKLPDNEETPVILIGAGTGVAPYRAFLQHREANDQKGKTWLFFGERRFHSDFLYQLEWQKLLKDGYLERIDVAFSRDQKEKVYVQNKLVERQKEVFDWLEKGANIYLCGDMRQMARDVQKTLVRIFEVEGGMSSDKAEEYLKLLKKQKRFMLDVY